MSSVMKGIIDEEDIDEVNLNSYKKKERFDSYVLGKRPPKEAKLIGEIGNNFPVYRYADEYGENEFFVTSPKSGKTVIFLSTEVPSSAKNVHKINIVVASDKSPGVDKLYRFLVLKKDLVLVGDDQSEGARKVWKKATRHPGINVHGFNPKTGNAFHLRASDEEGYSNATERDKWRADKKNAYGSGLEPDKLLKYDSEIDNLIDVGNSQIVMHKRDKNMTKESIESLLRPLCEHKIRRRSSILKGIVGEDSDMQFAAEKTPAVNPYGGKKDRQFRGAISEMPDTSGPVGTQDGGWRQVKLKPAGQLDESDVPKWLELDHLGSMENKLQYYEAYAKNKGNVLESNEDDYIDSFVSLANMGDSPDINSECIMISFLLLNNKLSLMHRPELVKLLKVDSGKYTVKLMDQDNRVVEFPINSNSAIAPIITLLCSSTDTYDKIRTYVELRFDLSLPDYINEDTSYGGGGGQGGYAGQSYRKFRPKMAGTHMKKESAILKGIQM